MFGCRHYTHGLGNEATVSPLDTQGGNCVSTGHLLIGEGGNCFAVKTKLYVNPFGLINHGGYKYGGTIGVVY